MSTQHIDSIESLKNWAEGIGFPPSAPLVQLRLARKLWENLESGPAYASSKTAALLLDMSRSLSGSTESLGHDILHQIASTEDVDGSEASAVSGIMSALGYAPLPWQGNLVSFISKSPSAGPRYHRTVCASTPRQIGKTTTLLSLAITRMIKYPGFAAVFTAQSGKDARARFLDFWKHIQKSPPASLFSIKLGAGAETITYLPQGSTLQPFVPSGTASHGSTIDMAIIDEAFTLSQIEGDAILAGVDPAQLTSKHAQNLIISTIGGHDDGDFFIHQMETSPTFRLTYDGDPEDIDAIVRWHPGVPQTITEESIRDRKENLPRSIFRRSILNLTAEPAITGWDVIQEQDFISCSYTGDIHGAQAVAIDNSPDGADILIMSAKLDDDGETVVFSEIGSTAIDILADISQQAIDILADATAPNRSLIERMKPRGIYVQETKFSDTAAWTTELLTAIRSGAVALPVSSMSAWKELTIRPAWGGWVPNPKGGIPSRIATMAAILYHHLTKPNSSKDIIYAS